MHTKRGYAHNTLSKQAFTIAIAAAAFLVSFFYSTYFATFSFFSVWNYAGLFACYLALGGLGYCLAFHGQRNIVSVATAVLIPVLLYDSARMWRYSKALMWIVISAVIAGTAAAGVYALHKTAGIRKTAVKRRVCLGLAARTAGLLCCAVLLAAVLTGKYWIYSERSVQTREIAYQVSADTEEIADYENSLTYNIDTVSKLDPDGGWAALSLEEKAEVLETVIKVECRYFGMKDSAPVLKIAYLDENTLGEYSREADELLLSYQYVVDTNAGGYNVLQVLLHEMYHRYQGYQTRLLAAIREDGELAKYGDLLLLSDAAEYEKEFTNYISGADGSITSYLLYASQDLEIDAERYANSAVNDYYRRIRTYLAEE